MAVWMYCRLILVLLTTITSLFLVRAQVFWSPEKARPSTGPCTDTHKHCCRPVDPLAAPHSWSSLFPHCKRLHDLVSFPKSHRHASLTWSLFKTSLNRQLTQQGKRTRRRKLASSVRISCPVVLHSSTEAILFISFVKPWVSRDSRSA